MEEHVAASLGRVPLFKGADSARFTCERLGGLTNLVYRIGLDGDTYVLRMPGEGTGEYIDRTVAAHNARVAADAGVAAEVLFFDEDDGLML